MFLPQNLQGRRGWSYLFPNINEYVKFEAILWKKIFFLVNNRLIKIWISKSFCTLCDVSFIVASVIQRFSRVNWIGHRFKKKQKTKKSEKKGKKIAEQGFDPWTSGLWAQHASAAPLCCVCLNRNKRLYNAHTNIVEAFKRVFFFFFFFFVSLGARRGGTRIERGGIRLVHVLTKSTIITYFSGMKIDPKYAFLHAFFLICLSCSFQNLSIWPKTDLFFQFCTFLHSLNFLD